MIEMDMQVDYQMINVINLEPMEMECHYVNVLIIYVTYLQDKLIPQSRF